MELRLFSAAEVVEALPMAEAIEGMKAAYALLSAGQAQAPLRTHLAISDQDATLIMPVYMPGAAAGEPGALGLKVVSVFNSNPPRGLPLIHALVLALDSDTGEPRAIIHGGALTTIRTGAASGAATDLLARPDASVVAIFGSGIQARTQLEAVCTVRRVERVLVYSLMGAEQFAAEMAGRGPVPNAIEIVSTPAAAVREADIICTATTARAPVFDGHDLRPGTHINAIGAFTPEMQEIDIETVRRSLIVVDSREAALAEAGDLIIPLRAGLISLDHIHAELGEIVTGTRAGRTSPEQITFFKSVGVAVQDGMAAQIILRNGLARGLGSLVTL
jgi:ornithine cyclodeaminase/alanine dehydrogenase-like protein (mu-crystallin family)